MQDRLPTARRNLLASYGRTIHWVIRDRCSWSCLPAHVRFAPKATKLQSGSAMPLRPNKRRSRFAAINQDPARNASTSCIIFAQAGSLDSKIWFSLSSATSFALGIEHASSRP